MIFRDIFRAIVRDANLTIEGRSPLWPGVRKTFLKTNPGCMACGGIQDLEIHHMVPFHIRPDLELDTENLITLCETPSRNCHYRIGHSFDWKAYNSEVVNDARESLLRIITRKYK